MSLVSCDIARRLDSLGWPFR